MDPVSAIQIRSWPVRVSGGGVAKITQEYKPGKHLGVDIAVPGQLQSADADVLAVADGVVERAYKSQRGWAVLVQHPGGWSSAYLHLGAIDVEPGDHVVAGMVLGPMGADPLDGEHVVHLHLQIAVAGQTVDPARYLDAVET